MKSHGLIEAAVWTDGGQVRITIGGKNKILTGYIGDLSGAFKPGELVGYTEQEAAAYIQEFFINCYWEAPGGGLDNYLQSRCLNDFL